jgi:site-specific recombinase XerD
MAKATNNTAFHVSDAKYAEYARSSLSSAVEEGRITREDAALIEEFTGEIAATSQISQSRKYKITYTLVGWRRFIGPFTENLIGDLYSGVEAIRTSRKDDGTPEYTQNTFADYIRFLKRFYRWLAENEYSAVPVAKVNKIKVPRYQTGVKNAEELLEPEDVRRMLEACTNSRDRAMISLLYEGGFRVGEIGNLTWRQVKFTDWNATVNTDHKTGIGRYVPLVMSREYLAEWRNNYPLPVTPDAHVFLSHRKRPFQYRGMAKRLRIIAKRAGVEKKVNPHLFRHSRITHMLQQGYSESVIKKLMWGNLDTDMLSTYGHLTDADIDDEIAAMAGVKPPAAKEAAECLEPRQCPRCYTVNGPTVNFCGRCGLELTMQAVEDVRIAEEQAELTPEYQALYNKIMRDLQKVA